MGRMVEEHLQAFAFSDLILSLGLLSLGKKWGNLKEKMSSTCRLENCAVKTGCLHRPLGLLRLLCLA